MESVSFFFFWEFERNFSRLLAQNCMPDSQKCIDRVQRSIFNRFFQQSELALLFRRLSKNFSVFWSKLFNRVVKTSFWVLREEFREKNAWKFSLFYFSFPIFREKISQYRRRNSRLGCENCILRWQKNIMQLFFLQKNLFVWFFSDFEQTLSPFSMQNFRLVC